MSVNLSTRLVPPSVNSLLRMLVVCGLLCASLFAMGQGVGQGRGRILVKFRTSASATAVRAVVSGFLGHEIGEVWGTDIKVLTLPDFVDARRTVAGLNARPEVQFAEIDQLLAPSREPDDPLYPNQWHLTKIGAPTAWDTTVGSESIIIAILDTGVDGTHPDLVARMVPGRNIYDDNTNTADVLGHGTSVAGTASASGNNALGVASVSWNTKIMPVRISDPSGLAYTSVIASGLGWARTNGARVANISYPVSASLTVQYAAQAFQENGGVVAIAAGNDGSFSSLPDNPYVLSVSATTSTDAIASFSTTGNFIDLAAPGVGIWFTTRGGGYGSGSGTSFSSPVVAGVAALVLSEDPSLTGAEAQQIMLDSADDKGAAGWDATFGWGRVNAQNAVQLAANGLDTTPPTVSFTAPADGAGVSGSVSVQVSAADNVGVASVELLVDMASVGTLTSAPYNFTWDSNTVGNGARVLTAIAKDAAGNSMSTQITLNVLNDSTPPTVSFASPANGATVSGSVSALVSASDDVGVTAVEFRVDGVLVGTKTSAPYNFTWDSSSAPNGDHVFKATARDAAGHSADAQITVNAQNDTTPPAVSFASPANGATVSGSVSVVVSASDNVGVAAVEFRVDGVLVGSDSSAPYAFTWDSRLVSNGTHALKATARDAVGNSADAQITVTAQNDTTPPTVVIRSPRARQRTPGRSVIVLADASDNVRVAQVELYVDGVLVSASRGGSFTTRWTPSRSTSRGAHSLQLKAYDAAGNVGSSVAVTVYR